MTSRSIGDPDLTDEDGPGRASKGARTPIESVDCVVVGGGPAGLAAAIQLGRLRRSCLVVDDDAGRSQWSQVTRNHLAFPMASPPPTCGCSVSGRWSRTAHAFEMAMSPACGEAAAATSHSS